MSVRPASWKARRVQSRCGEFRNSSASPMTPTSAWNRETDDRHTGSGAGEEKALPPRVTNSMPFGFSDVSNGERQSRTPGRPGKQNLACPVNRDTLRLPDDVKLCRVALGSVRTVLGYKTVPGTKLCRDPNLPANSAVIQMDKDNSCRQDDFGRTHCTDVRGGFFVPGNSSQRKSRDCH